MTKVRCYCTADPAPGMPENPGDTYMRKQLGFEPLCVVNDGHLNRALTWSNDDGTLRTPATFDSSRTANYSNPPVERAVKAAVRLACGRANNYKPGLPPAMHVVFNLEQDGASNPPNWAQPAETYIPELTKVAGHWCDVMRWAKEAAPYASFSAYYWPTPMGHASPENFGRSRMAELCASLDYAMPSYYNVSEYVAAPSTWYDATRRWDRFFRRWCPDLPKIATVTPTYQTYAADPLSKSLLGKPVPQATWKRQLNYLVELGYELYVWLGETKFTPEIEARLREVNALQN